MWLNMWDQTILERVVSVAEKYQIYRLPERRDRVFWSEQRKERTLEERGLEHFPLLKSLPPPASEGDWDNTKTLHGDLLANQCVAIKERLSKPYFNPFDNLNTTIPTLPWLGFPASRLNDYLQKWLTKKAKESIPSDSFTPRHVKEILSTTLYYALQYLLNNSELGSEKDFWDQFKTDISAKWKDTCPQEYNLFLEGKEYLGIWRDVAAEEESKRNQWQKPGERWSQLSLEKKRALVDGRLDDLITREAPAVAEAKTTIVLQRYIVNELSPLVKETLGEITSEIYP